MIRRLSAARPGIRDSGQKCPLARPFSAPGETRTPPPDPWISKPCPRVSRGVHTDRTWRLPVPAESTAVHTSSQRMLPTWLPTQGLPMAHAFVVTSSNDGSLAVLLGRATKLPVGVSRRMGFRNP